MHGGELDPPDRNTRESSKGEPHERSALPSSRGVRTLRPAISGLMDEAPDSAVNARALEAAAITAEDGADAFHDRMQAWRETLRATIRAGADALFDTRVPLEAFAALL